MKKFTKMLILALAMVMTVGVGNVAEAKGTVQKVQITSVGKTNVKKKSKITVKRDAKDLKLQLAVSVKTKKGASEEVTYKTSNKKVIAVSKTGMLTVKKAGTAKITVTSKQNKKKKDTIKITVKQNVTGIKATFKGTKPVANKAGVVTLVKGKKYQLKATVAPKKASNKKVTFTSSKKKVVAVTKSGKITAKKTGKAKITIKAKDGSGEKLVLNVYVVAKKVAKKDRIKEMSAALDKEGMLIAGETAKVNVTVNKGAKFTSYAFKSNNVKVAKVDATTGKVTAVAPGKATITVYAMDGSGKKTTVEVQVGSVFTKVAPKEGTTATVTVSFTGDAKAIAADVEKMLKTVMKDGDSKMVTVNGNTDKVAMKAGKVVVGETEMALADYIAKKVAKDDKVTVTYGANAAKAVAAIELAKFAAVGEYTYDITIDGMKATKLVVTTEGIELTVDGKTYAGTVEAGVIYVEGDVTADKAMENVKKYADVTVVRK